MITSTRAHARRGGMVYRRRTALKTAMLKRMIFYSAILLLTPAGAARGNAGAGGQGGAASRRFDQEERQQHYQHRVWLGLLGQHRTFVTETIDDGVLDDAGRLKQYRAVVIPSTRTVLTPTSSPISALTSGPAANRCGTAMRQICRAGLPANFIGWIKSRVLPAACH